MSAAPAGGDKKNIVKMAYIYFQEGRWDKAIEEYKKLLALDPEDINTHNMLGDVFVKKGAVREAFEEYIKVSADFASRGQGDKAVVVNKKISALDTALLPPESQKKQNLIKQTIKAETALEQGLVDEAIEALSEVLKLDTENLVAYSKLGELYEKKGRIPEAIQQYQMLGAAFMKNRIFKKAQDMFQKVVQLDPANVEARNNLAQIYIKQGSESDAKKEFLNAAEMALNAGDLDNAQAYASKAVELKSIEAHYVLGIVLYKKQKLSEAKLEFESLLRFKVNHVGALTHLGKVLMETGQEDKAAENIQKALKLEKDNLIALEAWVELSVKKGNKNEALSTLAILIDKYTESDNLTKALEFAKYMVSIDENAIPSQNKLVELLKRKGDKTSAADVLFKIALIYEKQNKKDSVLEFVKKTLEMNPSHGDAQKRMAGTVPVEKAPEPQTKSPAAGVMDLEQEAAKPIVEVPRPPMVAPVPAPISPPAEKSKPAIVELDLVEDLKAQVAIADNYVKQGLLDEAIEIYQQLMEAHPDHPELKEKLNLAYTAYVKTGEDVIGALEAEKTAKEEEEKRLRLEMEKKAEEEAKKLREELEKKAREEAEKKVRAELEKKAREEAETKAREEIERRAAEDAAKRAKEEADKKALEDANKIHKAELEQKAKAEAESKIKEEMETRMREEALKKVRAEVEQKVREEMEAKARVEAEHRMRQDAEKKAREEKDEAMKRMASLGSELTTSKTPPPSKGDSVVEEGRDEFMSIAVADIYFRQQFFEEAAKIYRHIVQHDPNNLEARKKLTDVENLMKSKTDKVSSVEAASPQTKAENIPPDSSVDPEKDSGGKKKSNRVGYV